MYMIRENGETPDTPIEALDAIASFLRNFLLCDDHQLAILILWIAHTWCFSRFRTFPYLDIRSPESQCGKSVCLKLLETCLKGYRLQDFPAGMAP